MTKSDWEQKVEAKQASVVAKIPAEWKLKSDILEKVSPDSTEGVLHIPRISGILTEKEVKITEDYDATSLVEKLASREFTSLEVVTAFVKRATIAQQLTSCLTETFFDQALDRAKKLDEHLVTTGRLVGPLHGLPISIKDSFDVVGTQSTIGFVSFLDIPPATHNSALVDVLLGAGAVLYTKTNIPQTLMTADSSNNIFGRVLNPHKLSLGAGGSSGGEGALIAIKGSPLGVGTDIAGSIRIPSICCGTYGFKPTTRRVPYAGQTSSSRLGPSGLEPSAGPLARSARDMELFLKVVFNSNATDFDHTALGVPWIQPEQKSTLTIGVMPEDPNYPLHPPIQRTLQTAIEKLRAAGHSITDLSSSLRSMPDMMALGFKYLLLNPDDTSLNHIEKSGEPRIPSLLATFGPPGEAKPEIKLREFFDMNIEKDKYEKLVMAMFVENKLDVIIGPGFQSCAVPHDKFGMPPYTVLSNLLNVSGISNRF